MKLKTVFPDLDRFRRQGFPEAIYSPNKSNQEIIEMIEQLKKKGQPILVTKFEMKRYRQIKKKFPEAEYNKLAKMMVINKIKKKKKGFIAIITAGTADVPIAEEAATTAESLGNKVIKLYDIGVAGLHRLLNQLDKFKDASCAVVCAGMEGALPSVVGGLVSFPVIGVPTSVGYGSSFGGLTPLLTMLNSCAANVCCVNIDDGYGAGVLANLINKE